jgi:foldase protein PrsA
MAPRKTAAKKSTTSSRAKTTTSTPTKSESMSEPMAATATNRRPIVWIIAGLLILGGLLYLGQKYLVAATVNGEMISRLTLYNELEKQYGAQTLDGMITKTLVKQEAKNRNINVSQEDLDAEFKKIEERFTSQGQNLDEVLQSQGYSKEDLYEQVELQLLVEKMVADKIEVTDDEVTKYITDNSQFLPTGTPVEDQRADARESLRQEKINQEGQTLIQELKAKAKINSSIPAASTPQ